MKYNHPSEAARLPSSGRESRVVLFQGALYEESALFTILDIDAQPSPPKGNREEVSSSPSP